MCPIPPSSDDARWMQRALDLAQAMLGHVWPNPPVGCVIVKNGICVGEGATQVGGRPHAERVALERAGDAARGAVLYVTLEPCCHWGNTPPCVDAIIAAGIARVVASMQDPDPRVNGGGFAQLAMAGIAVDVGQNAEDAQHIMAGFLHRVRTGRPRITLLDEPTDAVPDGEDALLLSRSGLPILVLPAKRVFLDAAPTLVGEGDVLLRLGALGLTSIAMHADDPIVATLRRSMCQESDAVEADFVRSSEESL